MRLLTAFVVLLFSVSSLALSNICTRTPPSLWCEINLSYQMECGFYRVCQRYDNAQRQTQRYTYTTKPINITVLYEANSTASRDFLIYSTISTWFQNLSSVLPLELVPFGNAKLSDDKIVCEHGERECEANRVQSCLLAHFSRELAVNITVCTEIDFNNNRTLNETLNKCYDRVNITSDVREAVSKCNSTDEGTQLQKAAAQRTKEARPSATKELPWILVNDISFPRAQPLLQYNLKPSLYICIPGVCAVGRWNIEQLNRGCARK